MNERAAAINMVNGGRVRNIVVCDKIIKSLQSKKVRVLRAQYLVVVCVGAIDLSDL
jgi:hypothetical protein